jgi:hypothetical protein
MMVENIKVFKAIDFIQKSQKGKISLESSIEMVRQLGEASDLFDDYHILIDLRGTEGILNITELIKVAMEVAYHKHKFHNRLAVLLPDDSERIMNASDFKTMMEVTGLQFDFFVRYEEAIKWLTEGPVYGADADNAQADH